MVTGARVQHVSVIGRPTVRWDGGRMSSDTIVLPTGAPTVDRALHFARLEPQRSYALAFDHPDPPDLMLLSAHGSSRSVRDAPGDGAARRLLVGGEGHTVGRARHEQGHLDRLREWTAEHFPQAVETHHWSAQDYTSPDALPRVGLLPLGRCRVHVATGFAKWGMTNGAAAALAVSGQILGDPVPWAQRLHRGRGRLPAAVGMARINAGVAAAGSLELGRAALKPLPKHVPEGEGAVGREGLLPVDHRRAHVHRHGDLQPPRWGARVERCRPELRLPPPRVALRADRGGPRGTRHPSPRPARRRPFLKHP